MKKPAPIHLVPLALAALLGCDGTGPSTSFIAEGSLAVGHNHSCYLGITKTSSCWGWGGLGQLGNGDTVTARSPQVVVGGLGFVSLAAGTNHSCALVDDSDAYCWGAAVYGELGTGTSMGLIDEPARVVGGLKFSSISVGAGHTCGVTTSDELYCWGLGASGQLGSGGNGNESVPTPVATSLRFQAVAAGLNVTCGATRDGAAYCWDNNWGQLGGGVIGGSETTPTAVEGGHQFVSMAIGLFVVCGITEARDAYCWGAGSFGRLGAGPNVADKEPTPLLVAGGLKFRMIAVGSQHTCGVTVDFAAYCWGLNTYGKLGDDIGPSASAPMPVQGGLPFRQIGAGSNHTCGVTTSETVYCWGQNLIGQLGVPGRTDPTFTPLRVTVPG